MKSKSTEVKRSVRSTGVHQKDWTSIMTVALSGTTGGAFLGGSFAGALGAFLGGIVGTVVTGWSQLRKEESLAKESAL